MDEIDFSVVLYGKILRLFWKIHRKVFMKLPFGDDWKMNTTFMNIMNVFFCPRKLYFVEQYATPWPEYIRHNKVNFKYEGGKTYNLLTGKEVMYLHFFSLKKVWKACDYVPKDGFNEVLFSASGILFK